MRIYNSYDAFFWGCGGMAIMPLFFLIIWLFGIEPSTIWPQPPLGIALLYAGIIGGYGLGWVVYRLIYNVGGSGGGSSGEGPSGYDNDGAPLD